MSQTHQMHQEHSTHSTHSANTSNQAHLLEKMGLTLNSSLKEVEEKLPILSIKQIPDYLQITATQLTPAIDWALNRAINAFNTIKSLPADQVNWLNIVDFFDQEAQHLSYIWGLSNHFSGVCDSEEWRKEIENNQERVTTFFLNVSQDPIIHKHYSALLKQSLNPAQQKMIEDTLLEFKLNGAELSPENQKKFIELQNKSISLKKKISDNALDNVDFFKEYLSAEELDGVPKIYTQNWWNEEHQAYQITLKQPCYSPIMQYANDSNLRHRLYKTQITLASEITVFHQASEELNNEGLIHELLITRDQTAKLLGFENYAELSVANKMADSAQQVIEFIQKIATKAKPIAQKDLSELTEHSKTLGLETLELWDISYVAEKLKEKSYAYSEQEVRQYFTLDRVLEGLFEICERLFNIKIKAYDGIEKHQAWHPDVTLYQITQNGQPKAYFYLDLFARDQKHGGAWMNYALPYRQYKTHTQCPVAYLICNFQKPQANTQATLSHYELTTLFHEFGHGIHHMLTNVDIPGISGIEGVEWDAVELPSQFLENFCWDEGLIQKMSAHIQTKQPIPSELFQKMLAARNFQNGLSTLRQSVLGMFDVKVHIEYNAAEKQKELAENSGQLAQFAARIQDQLHVLPQNQWSRWPNTFTHIFAGGYAVGYYSYHWAEVLSCDVFAAFEEAAQENGSIINSTLGQKYLEEILSRGGSRKAIENFTAFRGRAPEIDAFLRHNGLA
jgi:oligopeptidase A